MVLVSGNLEVTYEGQDTKLKTPFFTKLYL